MSDLETVVEISASMLEKADGRPPWVRALPHADDPEARYYRALYEWSQALEPKHVLEIGTHRGWSAANLAVGSPSATVVTVDIDPLSAEAVAEFPVSNIRAITMDSAVAVSKIAELEQFDFLYIDANHTFNSTYGEYTLYRPLVRQGGLIIIDDVALVMDGDEMKIFWDFVLDPKERLDDLHHTGFGVCQVDHRIRVPSWQEVIPSATRRIIDRQGR